MARAAARAAAKRGSNRLTVRLSQRGGELTLPAGEVRRAVAAVLRAQGRRGGEIGLLLTDDAEIAALHGQFFADPTPTDVITFPRSLPDADFVVGEVVLSGEWAAREAVARGHSGREEALLYVVHGVLHLCGHRDDSPSAFAAMHACEDEILTGLGLGPIFAGLRPSQPRLPRHPRRQS